MTFAQPKWVLTTKRGWGMVLTGLTVVLPFVSQFTGVPLDPGIVSAVGQTVATGIDVAGALAGLTLLIWGAFRPTAPLKLLP